MPTYHGDIICASKRVREAFQIDTNSDGLKRLKLRHDAHFVPGGILAMSPMPNLTANGYGCGSALDTDIVKEWSIPGQHVGLDLWRRLTPKQQLATVEKEVEENGIERPKGYTTSFHYNARVEAHHFGKSHPMKPWRLTLTKQLIFAYGLHYAMDNFESPMATKRQLQTFHTEEYLSFLERLDPRKSPSEELKFKFLGQGGASEDCPVFDGMWDYFRLYSGASLDAVRNLTSGQSDIAINWSGGLHHAHKSSAAGFCYINDIVLSIQGLLWTNPRVLYIDIDVHHGDGVEEAFFSTDRVLTLSFHKYGDHFFPGTGAMDDIGPRDPKNAGAHHSLNVPLKDGINDEQWTRLFSQTVNKVVDVYDPTAIVLQCGADSLGGDRLGSFNLNIKAHGYCVELVKSLCHDRKLLIIGGGGYTPRNVARCWTHETAICVGAELKNTIPAHVPYRQAFSGQGNGNGELYPEFDNASYTQKFHENLNTDEYLQSLVANVHEQLRYIQGAPSVQMQHIPNDYLKVREEEDRKIKDEEVDKEMDGFLRKQKEKNVGGRDERRSS